MHGAGVRDPRRLDRAPTQGRGGTRREPGQPRKHVKFREKYGLPFALLSDEAHEVAELYGTWAEKSMSTWASNARRS
jgi:hypothetical protein